MRVWRGRQTIHCPLILPTGKSDVASFLHETAAAPTLLVIHSLGEEISGRGGER